MIETISAGATLRLMFCRYGIVSPYVQTNFVVQQTILDICADYYDYKLPIKLVFFYLVLTVADI